MRTHRHFKSAASSRERPPENGPGPPRPKASGRGCALKPPFSTLSRVRRESGPGEPATPFRPTSPRYLRAGDSGPGPAPADLLTVRSARPGRLAVTPSSVDFSNKGAQRCAVTLVLTFCNVRWTLPSELRRKPPVTGRQQGPRGHLPHRGNHPVLLDIRDAKMGSWDPPGRWGVLRSAGPWLPTLPVQGLHSACSLGEPLCSRR